MKMRFKVLLPLLLLLALPATVQAQGTVYLSNLAAASAGGLGVGLGEQLAQPFETGSAPLGYNLTSIQVGMLATNGPGIPTGFGISLCADNGGVPGSNLGSLSGSDNPSIGGIYTYAASDITLTPSTAYWVVASASQSGGFFWWSIASSTEYTSTDGWSTRTESPYGLILIQGDPPTGIGLGPLQFAVEATPVPEPGVCSLSALGLAVILLWRRR